MWAKKYLMEIQRLDEQMNEKIEELSDLETTCGKKGFSLSEKVQTSPRADGLENGVIKCLELRDKMLTVIAEAKKRKSLIISQIQELKDIRLVKVLYLRYVKYMSFESMAVELKYSYDHVTRLHAKALKDFERCHTMSVSNVI